MSAPLPDQIDPWRAVKLGSSFDGEIPLERLPRLAEAVVGAAGPVRYTLAFGRDSQGRAVARGQVSLSPTLICQRCLEPLTLAVDAPIALALVKAVSEADSLGLTAIVGVPDGLDPLPLGDEPICPLDLLEDELLLALPQIPLHPSADCPAAGLSPPPPDAAGERDNPFAVLAALRGAPGTDER